MRENCAYVFTSVGLYIRLSSVLYIRGLSLERRLRFGPKTIKPLPKQTRESINTLEKRYVWNLMTNKYIM